MKNNKISRFFYMVGIFTIITSVIGLVAFTILNISASEPTNFTYNDGPYIFYLNDSTIKTIIIKGNEPSDFTIQEKTTKNTFVINKFLRIYPEFNPFEKFELSPISDFTAEKIASVSDIHGSFHHFKQLLLANKIIDDSLNWSWGKGHLVIVGDVFDKGLYVSECLWLIKKLEAQSESQGGRVHFLLGNHERLVLSGNYNYISLKYREICNRLFLNYDQLFSNNTYWGKWLRSKSIIIKINNNLFTHGGISEQMLNKKYTLTEINKLFNLWVNTSNPAVFDERKRSDFNFIINYFGPLEYRGYYNINVFNRGQKRSFPKATLDKINQFYNIDHLIVGHTIVREIKSMFNNNVIAINIRYPEDDVVDNKSRCQMLIIEGENYYKADVHGNKRLLFTK